MGVWSADGDKELVVALVHRFGDMNRRADDQQFAVAWEYNGTVLREVQRLPMSCPDVELVVPSRGPFVYEVRLSHSPFGLHAECSCRVKSGHQCPAGVRIDTPTSSYNLTSPILSHTVSEEDEWQHPIFSDRVLGQITTDISAFVAPLPSSVLNSSLPSSDAWKACPGSWDEPMGKADVTVQQLRENGIRLPHGLVDGRWCLIFRGGCSPTAKVKLCEASGAVGTIIVDYGWWKEGDQHLTIKRRSGENTSRPVLFVSQAEGSRLAREADTHLGVHLVVGPSVAGPPPPGWTLGSGVVVHRIGEQGGQKAYPDLFETAAWAEVSDTRDLMFVCIPEAHEIRIYDISQPLTEMPQLGSVWRPCSRSGLHDYRVLDYRDAQGYHTVFIDPDDRGNRLFYYDTDNLANPTPPREVQVAHEAPNDGMGQVRPGPEGRYHFVTWHCSSLYCGKNHGDALYALDTENLARPALKVPLPMPSTGTVARDLACGLDGICLVSLTYDGLAVVDGGAPGSANRFRVVAQDRAFFGDAAIPQRFDHYRIWSGAQKVYPSTLQPRRFYVEFANFSFRHAFVGDDLKALKMRNLYLVELMDYDASVPITSSERVWLPRATRPVGPLTLVLLGLLVVAVVLLNILAIRLWQIRVVNRRQSVEIRQLQQASNVVVGRPMQADTPAAVPGQPVSVGKVPEP